MGPGIGTFGFVGRCAGEKRYRVFLQISYSVGGGHKLFVTMLRGTVAKRNPFQKGEKFRLNRLERKVAQLSPEVKYKSNNINVTVAAGGINIWDLTAMSTGANENNRIGDKIKLKTLAITGGPTATNAPIDFYIIRPKEANVPPVATNFEAVMGGHYVPTNGWAIRHYYLGGSHRDSFYRVNDRVNFKNPMIIEYADNASTHPTKNRLYGVFINRSAAAVPVSGSALMSYTDA